MYKNLLKNSMKSLFFSCEKYGEDFYKILKEVEKELAETAIKELKKRNKSMGV